MDKNFLNVLYIEHTDKIGVLSANECEVVSQVIGTDLTLVYDKKEGNTYLLIPLTKNHTFKYDGDSLEVDGKLLESDYFFRKDACQWVRVNDAILSKVA